MSIQSEIDRISQNVSDSLDAVEAKGVTIPSGSNSNDLPNLISAIEQIDVSEDTATPDVVADGYTFHLANGQRSTGTAKYAASPVVNGPATVTNAIHYAAVDSTSTSTKFTVTVPDVTSLYDGLTIMLYNGVVTSASNYTINVNSLGAYGTYSNMALGNNVTPTSPTRDTTIFNINYAMLMVFCTTIYGVGSGWICYRGYDANTNTVGYQIRTNSFSLPMTSIVYRYRLLFQSADNNHWVPATNSTSTNATSSRTVCQDPINPLGAIVYYGTTSSVSAGSRPSASNLWQQYTLNLGYSFQKSTNYSLTSWKPVYLKCELQSNGSAIMDSDNPIVQDLPSSDDGNLYILLGYAYSTTSIELVYYHPVYYYKDGTLRTWTGINVPTKTSQLTNDSGFITSANVPSPSDATPQALGTASAGSSANYSRADHVHTKPTYSKSDVGLGNVDNVKQYSSSNPPPYPVTSVNTKTGAVSLTASDVGALPDSTAIPQPSDTTPAALGTASAGTASTYSRSDHVHAKPTYSKSDVGLGNVDNVKQYSASNPPPYPVTSVNGSTGAVTVSVPSAATATPSDLGTAAVGTSTKWAKEDHVHKMPSASDVGALPDTTSIPSKTSDLTNDSGFITGMTILSYGSSTWSDFLTAYNANKVVYCRASSNSNPASGSQTRMAFLAYVNNQTTPTEVEFQYYRSVSTHTDSQQGDQVYIYKLVKSTGWSVTVRESYSKIATGTGISKSYSNGTITLSSTVSVPTASDATPENLGTAAAGSSANYSRADHVHAMPTASDVGALPSSTVIPSKVSDLTNDSGFVNASGAAAAAPVQSVNGKTGAVTVVEDDQTWNGVSLAKQSATNTGDSTYVPLATSLTPVNMSFTPVKKTPTANAIAKYDNSSYLYSTTPSDKDNSTKVATTAYVDSAIDDLPEPMVFKGSLGTGGTITTLPAASSSNTGFTYKVITAGTYASQAAKVGDTFISDGTSWVLIPSGDEPSGTVTSVGVSNATNGGLSVSGSPITSSGTISIGHSNVLTNAQTTQAVYPIKIDKNGHISAYGSAVSIPSKTSDLTNDSGFVNSSQAASAAPVQSVNGKMGDVVIDIKDDPQFAALVGFTSTGSSGVTQKDALGTKIMNKISAAKTASQLGFFYDATEDAIHLYLLFALQTSSNKRKFYRIVKYSDQQEPLTLEGGVGITVKEISIPADDQKIYTVRFNIQNPSSRADRKYASVRLAVVVYDDNDNEIERYYGAQYFYAYDDVTGTVSRTIYSNIERGPSDFIIDIGLKNNTNAAMGNYTTYIVGDTLSDGLSPIVATNQPTGFDLVVPDSFFDNAPFGYSIAAILGDFTRIYGPTVYKAEELTKNSVGLGNVANERQYSAENPPPYPVTSVNGSTGAVTVAVPSAATATPSNLGTAAVGTSTKYAKEDHVHNYPDVVHVGSTAPSDSNIELWLDSSSGGNSVVSSVDGKTGTVTVLPSGGTTGQVLKKVSGTSYDVTWANESGSVTSVNGQTGDVTVSTIAVQDNAPSGGELVWIDTDEPGESITIPQIDDSNVSAADTWSSQKIRDFIYPVGSIYMSVNATSPATIFGGTWEQIEDTFLLAAGTNYTAGATGGEAAHTLSATEIPAHTHGRKSLTGSLYRAVLDDGDSITRSGIVSSIDSPRTSTWKSEGGTACYRVNFDASHEHDSVGGGGAHNNMPPYLAVYMWKRTA